MTATLRNALLLGLLLAPLAQADEPKPDDEIVVEANRTNLVKLGKEVQMAEFRFYKRYNELNKKREYAIQCESFATLGSRFTNNYCQPVYKTKAEAEAAQRFFIGLDQDAGSWGTPAYATIMAGRPAYQKNVVEVTANSAELQQMLQEHQKLWKQWETMYYKVNGRNVPGKNSGPASTEGNSK